MSVRRRWRIAMLIVVQLAQKYTRALVAGFFLGLSLTLFMMRIYPVVVTYWFQPIERIGVVGDFSPNNLPRFIQDDISMGLTQVADDGAPLPGLAERWVATDSAKTYTFYLRNDLTWHNNKPVVAADVNYNIKNVTFTVLDAHTIQARLDNAYSPFPTLVSKPLFQAGLRGFGHYKVDRIRLNAQRVAYLKLVPVQTGSREKPKEFRFYSTESAAVMGYKLGEVDVLRDLSDRYGLEHWGNTTVVPKVSYHHIVSLFYNVRDQFLSEKTIRQALSLAVPGSQDDERALSPIAKNSWAYTDKVKKYTYDPTQAKKILAAAGVASLSAQLTISTFPQYADEAQKIADSWGHLGVPTQVKVEGSIPSDYQTLLSVSEVPPDPDQYPFWHSTQEQTNKTGFGNVKIDKLLEDGRQELDTAVRKKIYADFQRYLMEEVPADFLHYETTYTVSRGK